MLYSLCVYVCVKTYWELIFGFGTLCCLSLIAADAESVLSLYFSNVSGLKLDQSHLLRSQTCSLWNLWLGFKFVTFFDTNFYILRMSPGTSDIFLNILFFVFLQLEVLFYLWKCLRDLLRRRFKWKSKVCFVYIDTGQNEQLSVSHLFLKEQVTQKWRFGHYLLTWCWCKIGSSFVIHKTFLYCLNKNIQKQPSRTTIRLVRSRSSEALRSQIELC